MASRDIERHQLNADRSAPKTMLPTTYCRSIDPTDASVMFSGVRRTGLANRTHPTQYPANMMNGMSGGRLMFDATSVMTLFSFSRWANANAHII